MLRNFFFGRHIDEDEELIAVIHKHWLLGAKALFWPTLSILLTVFVLSQLPTKLMFYLAALWTMISLVWWIRNFFDYYLDAWLITDSGIIDIEWFGWFHRRSTRILFSDIEGVSYEISGIGATLLRYGTVSIERISSGEEVELEYVPHPREVEGIILDQMEEYLNQKNLKDSKHVQEILANLVSNQLQLEDMEENGEGEEEEEEEYSSYQ
ncbi:hypothetical protein COU77_02450 [Candidatus Peregrinibacteria bacterium CG10_big_fil_rev_8_21_14_0_10_49_16]|nr:MAG: hypothetical protein COW95_01390 [Candidatus Peregrinibacteria bacterium CG22_combo_CG10-13_8_21_14_all_49_11]PIR52069.1 MAG: hypothetical protein COU77_02450 [Candidatus Peregrinibacteria bacterium CG10_big_fil_rev_8_21_14_0_10_49_16]